MHDATAGLFAVGSARRLDLAGLDGKGGTRVKGAGRTQTRRDCDEHKQAGNVYKNLLNIHMFVHRNVLYKVPHCSLDFK